MRTQFQNQVLFLTNRVTLDSITSHCTYFSRYEKQSNTNISCSLSGYQEASALHRVCGTTNTFVSKMGLIASCVVIVEVSNKDDHGFKVNIL